MQWTEAEIQSDDDDDDEMERVQATDDDATEQRPPVNGSGNGDAIAGSAEVAAPKAKMDNELEVVEQSGSQKAIENLLKVYYEPLEVWFLRTSIEKVSCHLLALGDALTPGAPPRLARYVFSAVLVVHPGRHVLPPQAGTQSGHVVWFAQHAQVDAREAGHGRRERLPRRDQEEDGVGVLCPDRRAR